MPYDIPCRLPHSPLRYLRQSQLPGNASQPPHNFGWSENFSCHSRTPEAQLIGMKHELNLRTHLLFDERQTKATTTTARLLNTSASVFLASTQYLQGAHNHTGKPFIPTCLLIENTMPRAAITTKQFQQRPA